MGKAYLLALLLLFPFGATAFEDRVDLETGKIYEYTFFINEHSTLNILQYANRNVCVTLDLSPDLGLGAFYINCAAPNDED